ncbi:2-succinyl-6-hydroxy-2,4-cyclohexadiene-1-carboxylate synthase [Vibrio salinus]|uniref:2-succinyl-6-hydroxy-2, 4-cyclohexadiene-1-carboxylate synthase n=1 Tax=Vibrio salinus TaxID=2899784 RepID=UPI001E47D3C2|nr:2-succinyl-6-hydroxy-2,4-cyclohexadiene-1-carboxylate synthase [Vibrio salinus]MCE0494672.1 2-succinyl-6-hydroxy-2,4-cyclohexadiene-1-carboxylate synthase [Vibrio salinus]
MLYSHYYPAASSQQEKPTLVFLHGLLGDGHDWADVISQLSGLDDYPCLTIDLCGHGRSRYKSCHGFDHISELIESTVRQRVGESVPVILVAYSLGARIAMYAIAKRKWPGINVVSAVIEGGSFGLLSQKDKDLRWQNDMYWAKRFGSEHLEQVIADWYEQPVFASLDDEQKDEMIVQRSDNLGVSVAEMLLATSLSRQPYVLEELKSQPIPVLYLCGGKDTKFRNFALESGLNTQVIDGAGHNAHKEQPEHFAQCINDFIFNTFKVNSSQ